MDIVLVTCIIAGTKYLARKGHPRKGCLDLLFEGTVLHGGEVMSAEAWWNYLLWILLANRNVEDGRVGDGDGE